MPIANKFIDGYANQTKISLRNSILPDKEEKETQIGSIDSNSTDQNWSQKNEKEEKRQTLGPKFYEVNDEKSENE